MEIATKKPSGLTGSLTNQLFSGTDAISIFLPRNYNSLVKEVSWTEKYLTELRDHYLELKEAGFTNEQFNAVRELAPKKY